MRFIEEEQKRAVRRARIAFEEHGYIPCEEVFPLRHLGIDAAGLEMSWVETAYR